MRSIAEQGVAEVIGTMALVFIGAGSVVIAGAGASSLLGVALARPFGKAPLLAQGRFSSGPPPIGVSVRGAHAGRSRRNTNT